MASATAGGDGASGGTSAMRRIRSGEFWTATWPSTTPPSTVALSTTGSDVAGRTRPTAPSVRPAISSACCQFAGDLGEADEDEVAERVAVELARGEAVVERLRPLVLVVDAVVGRERDEALAEVAHAEHAEVAPQPAGGAAVVGDAHHRGDVAGVLAHRAERGGEAVPAADGDDARAGPSRHSRSTSRCRMWGR